MAWITPKTDWQARYNDAGEYIGDFINVVDYNRICGNLQHLKNLYAEYNKPNPIFITFEDITVNSLAHSREWNIIENNLEELIKKYGGLNSLVGNKKTYVDNGKVIDYNELNRIESISLQIDNLLPLEYACQKQLQYSLGLDNIGIFSTRVNGVE